MPEKKAERPEGQMRRRPMRRRKKVCAVPPGRTCRNE